MNIYCGNCGKYGHIYKKCNQPIMSLGIICFKIIDEKIHYLLIKRKCSLNYVELIRGKYTLDKIEYIYKLFEQITQDERQKILENDFNTLWNELWVDNGSGKYRAEYETSKYKFNALKEGYLYEMNNTIKSISVEDILKETVSTYETTEWGFPKGRRNINESDLDCSKREFSEETGLKYKDFKIYYKIKPLEEIYTGTNSVRYRHIYYLASVNSDIDVKLDIHNKSQISEISDIGFYTYEECMNMIRPYNIEKKQVLKIVNDIIVTKINLNYIR